MSGRIPNNDLTEVERRDRYNKHRSMEIGKALQEKLKEDKAERFKHQRNDLIKNDGTSIRVKEGEN